MMSEQWIKNWMALGLNARKCDYKVQGSVKQYTHAPTDKLQYHQNYNLFQKCWQMMLDCIA